MKFLHIYKHINDNGCPDSISDLARQMGITYVSAYAGCLILADLNLINMKEKQQGKKTKIWITQSFIQNKDIMLKLLTSTKS